MNNIVLLFICIAVPFLMMSIFLDSKSRIFVYFMCIGCLTCLIASEMNSIVSSLMPERDLYYITVNITPIIEEVFKTIPILVFALFIEDDCETLINISMVTGFGFAILENTYLLINIDNPSLMWALIRGLGAGFMHGLATLFVGYGLSFIKKKKAFLYPGIIGLFVTAIIFHSSFNALCQTDYPYIGYIYPILVLTLIKISKTILKKIN